MNELKRTKIKTIIVDDEPLAIKILQAKLAKLDNIEVVASCKNGREALKAIAQHDPDLVFLDIQMPGISGLDVVKQLQGDNMPLVIFLTAYEQYALEAFDAHAVDYVLKPIDDERILRAVERANERMQLHEIRNPEKTSLIKAIEQIREANRQALNNQQTQSNEADNNTESNLNNDKIMIKDRGEITIIEQHEIEWIDAAGDYVCVHLNGQTHIKRCPLKDLLEDLNPEIFKRIHRSTIVNLNFIKKVLPQPKGEYFLLINEHDKIKVSRNYRDVIKAFLGDA